MKINLSVSIVFSLLLFMSCKEQMGDFVNTTSLDKDIGLGAKLENPYSLKNMQRAYDLLDQKTKSDDSFKLSATHLYLKFKPANEEELTKIKQDTSIVWYSYPMDHEEIPDSENYHEPAIPDSLPTYQYASINIDKWSVVSFKDIEHEILEELFIPDEDKIGMETRSGGYTGSNGLSDDVIDKLVTTAFIITHNEVELNQTKSRGKWRPQGVITYEDEHLGKIGMEGVRVDVKRWFTTHTGFVDANGYYSCDGKFKGSAKYNFKMERYNFRINGAGVREHYSSNTRKGNFDYHFSRKINESEYFIATIFRAAFHYYYKDIQGLRRPPMNSTWKQQLKIKARNSSDELTNGNFSSYRRFLGLGNHIHIFNQLRLPYKTSRDIYATTIHELAHASHWAMSDKEGCKHKHYLNAETKMVESWATGVQWVLTKMQYTDYRGKVPNSTYTNIVMDMIDSKDDDNSNRGKTESEGDIVEGYYIAQLEAALIGSSKWDQWKENIKNKYSNETEQYIDKLFSIW